ncbi:MAG: hypothetical protein C0599_17275 [Salinivirgaceae bacterium]|nr:MAG: hypothetical protein C0599_17275 [Salinivirgaceae bacterium]
MKNFLLPLLLISALVLSTSCKKDDDETTERDPISGNWNLKNVSGGFGGVDIDYTPGEVIWNFNLNTNILTVQKNIEPTDPSSSYVGLESGTYPFEIEENEETKTLFVNGEDKGFITLLDDVLQLNEGYIDGFMRTFER